MKPSRSKHNNGTGWIVAYFHSCNRWWNYSTSPQPTTLQPTGAGQFFRYMPWTMPLRLCRATNSECLLPTRRGRGLRIGWIHMERGPLSKSQGHFYAQHNRSVRVRWAIEEIASAYLLGGYGTPDTHLFFPDPHDAISANRRNFVLNIVVSNDLKLFSTRL